MARKMRPDGYVTETTRGRVRHRVRVAGNKAKRITIPCGPDDPTFWEHYYAAREGRKLEVPEVRQRARHRDLGAMFEGYLAWLADQVKAGSKNQLTLNQRISLLRRVANFPDGNDVIGTLTPDLPPQAMVAIRDAWGASTAQADNSLKAIRAAYEWGIERGWVSHNPAVGIAKAHKPKGGAKPWSTSDMQAFLKAHREGTPARLWLLLALFTGARLDDLRTLGRGHETRRDGIIWLEWKPGKAGSAPVSIPMADQLYDATRSMPVQGSAYLLNSLGQPWKSGPSLAERARKWTAEAGLERRSSHGLRKSLGGLLAEAGATQQQIMSVLAHTSPKTSEVYTRSAQRAELARAAMRGIKGLKLG